MKRPISPLTTVIVYAICGIAWILITDFLLINCPGNISFDMLWLGQHFKGILFILLSSLLLFGLIRRNLAKLQASAKAYSRMFHENPQPMWIVARKDARFLEVNDAAIRLYGYSREEFLSMTTHDVRIPDDIAQTKEHTGKGRMTSGQWQHHKKDGTHLYVRFEAFSTVYGKFPAEVISLHDITDKYLADEALTRQDKLLKTIINSTNHMVWAMNAQLQFIAANDSFHQHAIHLSGIEVPSPYWKALYEKCLAGEKQLFDFAKETDDGNWSYVEVAFEPITHKEKITGVACLAQDITDRKRQELALKKALERYDIVSLATNDAIWDLDLVTRQVAWNDNAQHLFGFSQLKEHTSEWWARIHPEDVDAISVSIEQAFREKQQHWSGEYRLRGRKDRYRHVASRGYIMYDNKQGPVRMIGALQDIEDRKAQQEEIRKLSLVASMTHSPIIITDPHAHIEWVNKSFEDLYGYELADIKGQQPYAFLHGPDTNENIMQEIREKITSSQPCVVETLHYSEDGVPYWVMMDITPVMDTSGRIERLIMIQTNITERKKIQQQLEEKNNLLMDVAYISSHRLRKPVASMLGVLAALDRSDLSNPENAQLLEFIERLTNEMDGMLHELADKCNLIYRSEQQ